MDGHFTGFTTPRNSGTKSVVSRISKKPRRGSGRLSRGENERVDVSPRCNSAVHSMRTHSRRPDPPGGFVARRVVPCTCFGYAPMFAEGPMTTHCSLVSEHCFMYLGSICVQASGTRTQPGYNPFPAETAPHPHDCERERKKDFQGRRWPPLGQRGPCWRRR